MTIDALAAGIITLGSLCTAIVAVGKLINLASKPNKDQNVRLTKLEDRMAKCESKLLNDTTRWMAITTVRWNAAKKRSRKEYLKMEGQSDD